MCSSKDIYGILFCHLQFYEEGRSCRLDYDVISLFWEQLVPAYLTEELAKVALSHAHLSPTNLNVEVRRSESERNCSNLTLKRENQFCGDRKGDCSEQHQWHLKVAQSQKETRSARPNRQDTQTQSRRKNAELKALRLCTVVMHKNSANLIDKTCPLYDYRRS